MSVEDKGSSQGLGERQRLIVKGKDSPSVSRDRGGQCLGSIVYKVYTVHGTTSRLHPLHDARSIKA
jgi:hypothetical protein